MVLRLTFGAATSNIHFRKWKQAIAEAVDDYLYGI